MQLFHATHLDQKREKSNLFKHNLNAFDDLFQ